MMNGLGLDAFNHLRFKRGFCCLAAVLLAGQWFCFGQEAGIAYWGSFGEGPNRVEGVFVELSEYVQQKLKERGWRFYTFIGKGGCRFMCSWDTKTDDISCLISDLRELLEC